MRILVVAGHALFREGLKRILTSEFSPWHTLGAGAPLLGVLDRRDNDVITLPFAA
jgi:hypothetical protein